LASGTGSVGNAFFGGRLGLRRLIERIRFMLNLKTGATQRPRMRQGFKDPRSGTPGEGDGNAQDGNAVAKTAAHGEHF
jgi:hypothetical protein